MTITDVDRGFPTGGEELDEARRAMLADSITQTLDSERLKEELRFNLRGHELRDPVNERGHVLGEIIQVDPVSPEGDSLPCTVYAVDVWDEFIAADPVGYKLVNDYVSGIEYKLTWDGFDIRRERQEATSSENWNKYTKAWLADPNVAGLAAWRSLVPTARALGYLTHNKVGETVYDRAGQPVVISPETAAHFRFVDDAIGIRSRGVAMSHLLGEHIKGLANGDALQILSEASGTAEPVIEAAVEATNRTGRIVHLTVADIDRTSLAMVEENAKRRGFEGRVTTLRMDILHPDTGKKITEKSGIEQFDVVENMGFEEYLPEDGDVVGARREKGLPQASEFTRVAFSKVKPGGILLSGNMVYPRTQGHFVFGVVDWPTINARTETDIMRVYEKAGLLNNPEARVEMYRIRDAITGTHIYNIVKVTKVAKPDAASSTPAI